MLNKNGLLRLLRIKPEETKIVFFIFLFAFFIGIAQNILSSVPLAMFLAHYNSSLLPYIYVGSGIALFFAGIGFSYLERTVSIFHVFSIPIATFAGSLFLFWGSLFVWDNPWIFMVLLIWSMLIVFLIISILMLISNQIFTMQQSKRLFGLIWCGVALGGIIIGFGMDFLVNSIGPNNVILLASLILLFGLITQFLIRKHSGTRLLHGEKSEEATGPRVSLKSFKSKNYILCTFLLTALIYFIFLSFDLLFNTSVQKQFPTEVEMAAFYGLLYATYDIANLFTAFFLSPWVLSRFGLIASLLVWPGGLVIFLGMAFLANLMPLFAGAFFAILVGTAIFEVVLVECITFESILLLFQPLRPAQRTWAQIKNEALIVPLAMTVIGIILLIIDRYIGIKASFMTLFIIGLCLIGIALTLYALKKGYLKLLSESLSKRSIINPQFTKLDKESLELLKGRLRSRYAEEVIYVLQTIENIDHEEFVKALPEALDNPLEEVRSFSLRKIEEHRIKSIAPKLKEICTTETNPNILAYALPALGSITDLEQFNWFKNHLHSSNSKIASSSSIALIKYGTETEQNKIMETLSEKAKSLREEDRLMVANILKQINISTKTDLLLPLLRDVSYDVRNSASEAAAHVLDEKLYPTLVENLAIPHVHDAAFNTLLLLGNPIFEYISQNFDRYSPDIQIGLINLLGFMKEVKPLEFLEKLLPISSRKGLRAVLLSLRRLSYKATDDRKHTLIKKLLESENKNILYLKEFTTSFNFEKMKLLRDLLCREIELSRECCFLLLSFIYSEASIIKAEQGLILEDEDANSNAVELLLQTLNKIDQKLLIEQLTYSPYKEEKGPVLSDAKIEELLLKTINYGTNCFIPELSAAVIYMVGTLELKNLIEFVHKQENKNNPLMTEIIPWSLKKLKSV